MRSGHFYVKWYDPSGDQVGSWSVLESFGCDDMDDRILCDCPDVMGDSDTAQRDAEAIADAMNKRPDALLHAELLAAAEKVLAHLNLRLEVARENGDPMPLYDGIADLHDAVGKCGGKQ